MWQRRLAVVGVAATGLLATACSDGGAAHPTRTPATAPPVAGLPPGAKTFLLKSGSFGWGPVIGTPGVAVFDPAANRLWLGVRLTNIGAKKVTFLADLKLRTPDGSISLDLDRTGPSDLPVRIPNDLTFSAAGVKRFDPARSELIVGGTTENQQIIPLGRGAPDALHTTLPRQIALQGVLRIERWSVALTGARILPGSPRGSPSPPGQQVIEFDMTVHSALVLRQIYGFDPTDFLKLRLPDGSIAKAVDGSDTVTPYTGTDFPNLRVDFPVPDPAAGTFQLVLQDRTTKGINANEHAETTGFAFNLPQRQGVWREEGSPAVPAMPAEATTTVPPPAPLDSTSTSFAYGGDLVTPVALKRDPAHATVTIDLTVRNIGRARTLFDAPATLAWGTHALSTSAPNQRDRLDPGVEGPDSYTFNYAAHLGSRDLPALFLIVGRDYENRAVIPLGSASGVLPVRHLPITLPASGAAAAEPWRVSVSAVRVGDVWAADQGMPAGTITVEIALIVTLGGAQAAGFSGTGQLFLRRADGLVMTPDSSFGITDDYQPSQQHSGWVKFFLPAPLARGAQLIVRSADESSFLVKQWDETTIPLTLD